MDSNEINCVREDNSIQPQNNESTIYCPVCSESFSCEKTLYKHKMTHSSDFRIYDMERNNRIFKVHVRIYTCNICEKEFRNLTHYEKHRKIRHTKEGYICPHCSKIFKDIKYMKIHMRTHSGERPYECDKCTKTFTRSIILRQHMLTHQKTGNHKCEFCSKSYKRMEDLHRHYEVH
ncbi:AAEL012177-PA [Aedes aegypti]|uniref:AAEL012177-PA n=1 Tax=Aedes aegypti TaxID=7159 RepID=Q16MW0_AEDAE|nr:AAEL012177-PA [Aedes aegypti]